MGSIVERMVGAPDLRTQTWKSPSAPAPCAVIGCAIYQTLMSSCYMKHCDMHTSRGEDLQHLSAGRPESSGASLAYAQNWGASPYGTGMKGYSYLGF